jgi:hypothetical protein
MTYRPVGEMLLEGDAETLLAEISARIPGDTPELRLATNGNRNTASGPGTALLQIVARYFQVLGRRFGQAIEKRDLAFLGLAGVSLVPPRPSTAPVVFRLRTRRQTVEVPSAPS